MRGDLCPYDHGTDPVIVEDVSSFFFTGLKCEKVTSKNNGLMDDVHKMIA
jgi:hypothetical protein